MVSCGVQYHKLNYGIIIPHETKQLKRVHVKIINYLLINHF